eukprot:6062091-Amphidinium_carterae.2
MEERSAIRSGATAGSGMPHACWSQELSPVHIFGLAWCRTLVSSALAVRELGSGPQLCCKLCAWVQATSGISLGTEQL